MNPDDLVTVAAYPNPQEASLAKALLEDEGIAAYLMGSEVSTTLWYVGTALGGVKLQVAEQDAERAQTVLKPNLPSDDAADHLEWVCANCGANVDAGFKVCWSCGTPAQEIAPASPTITAPKPAVPKDSLPQQLGQETESVDELASKALRAAVFGLVFFPLEIYALFLLPRVAEHEPSGVNRWKFYIAAAISVSHVLAMLWLFFFLAAQTEGWGGGLPEIPRPQ